MAFLYTEPHLETRRTLRGFFYSISLTFKLVVLSGGSTDGSLDPLGSQSHTGLPPWVNLAECLTCPIHVLIDILGRMSHYVLGFNETGDRD
jgi:hypothetical protein